MHSARTRPLVSLARYGGRRRKVPTFRANSTSASPKPKSYASTMSLPKTDFPLWSDPAVREHPYQQRTTSELYKWQATNATGPAFVLHDGPPYANGNLHMGHALNKILKDVINRFQVLQGRAVDFTPGWDCHGLPIENKALKEIGTGHSSIAPSQLRQIARQVAHRDMKIQMDEFKQFGIMADWSDEGTYRTMDPGYEIRQLRVFQELVRKGLIYRHYRPVHWSPSSKSALAEAELTYVDKHKSFPVYVKFRVQSDQMSPALRDAVGNDSREAVHLVIWTTTPWTLPANMAIAVNPKLRYSLVRRKDSDSEGILIIGEDRLEPLAKVLNEFEVVGTVAGAHLLGTAYTHMFSPESSDPPRLLAWNQVAADTGTGLVHMAPAHGLDDYYVLKASGMFVSKAIVCPVDGDGKYTTEVKDLARDSIVGEALVGQDVLGAGSKAIVGFLKDAGVLVAQETIKHRYPYDWKTNQPIIVRATSQWFASVDDIKEAATNALKQVNFYPEVSRTRLESFIRERSEWCISRQRSWGVPIPALYDAETDEAILTAESLDHIIPILKEKGIDYWFDGPVEAFLPPSLRDSGRTYIKGTDTVDVWFDSGTSWSMLPNRTGNGDRECLADVCLEGSDQHRGWFQSLLLTATGTAETGKEKSPYKNLITHGFVLDDKGKKMSKSLGNVISPLTIINGGQNKSREPAYGADVLRLWAASVEYGRDVSIGPKMLSQSAESLRKLRNTIRFMLSNLRDGVIAAEPLNLENMSLADKFVMHQLYVLEQTCLEAYSTFNFAKVVVSLNRFATTTLSSFYFDITKDTLYADHADHPGRRAVISVLNEMLHTLVPILAPILPHLAEEVHEKLGDRRSSHRSVFANGWKSVAPEWQDAHIASHMADLLRVRDIVMICLEEARAQKMIGGSLEAQIQIILPQGGKNQMIEAIRSEREFLKTLFVVSDVRIFEEADAPPSAASFERRMENGVIVRAVLSGRAKCPRCWQRTRLEEEEMCHRCTHAISHI